MSGPAGGGPAGDAVALRRGQPADAEVLLALTLDAIQVSAAEQYTRAQREAWAARLDVGRFRTLLAGTVALVAEVEGQPAGYANLDVATGELDMLYVAPAHGGRGIARSLLTALEAEALAAGLTQLDARASDRARPVFERLGWEPVEVERVESGGQVLTRTHVRRRLRVEERPDR